MGVMSKLEDLQQEEAVSALTLDERYLGRIAKLPS